MSGIGPVAFKSQNVCWSCRVGKQRCDKSLPSCSRCSSKLRQCNYAWDDSQLPSQHRRSSKAGHTTSWIFRRCSGCIDISPCGARGLLQAASTDGSSCQMIQLINECLENTGITIPGLIDDYRKSIHPWLPVVDPEHLRLRLIPWPQSGDAELAILVWALYLVTRRPCGTSEHTMRSTLYQTVRQMFMLRTSGSAAVELIQAGLLIAYYACGHGLPRDAHMTLAICVTLARLIGVDFEETGNSTGLDDRRSVCRWVIVLLDRTVAMSSVNDPMPLVLPLNLASNDKRLTSILDVKAPHRRFEVSSRVALLIGTALGHANDPRPIRLTGSTYRDIDNRMEILVRELVWASKDELDTYTYCESTALAVIAHLALQVVNPSSGKVGANSKEAMLLQSTLRMVRDQFRAATDMLPEGESYSMSVVALCNLTRAAAISLRICGNNFLHKELDELRAVLQRFSARWTLGGIYLEYIDEILRSSMPEADPSPVVQRDL